MGNTQPKKPDAALPPVQIWETTITEVADRSIRGYMMYKCRHVKPDYGFILKYSHTEFARFKELLKPKAMLRITTEKWITWASPEREFQGYVIIDVQPTKVHKIVSSITNFLPRDNIYTEILLKDRPIKNEMDDCIVLVMETKKIDKLVKNEEVTVRYRMLCGMHFYLVTEVVPTGK
jgi:hypothetical protein